MMTKLNNVIALVAFAIAVVETCDVGPLGMSSKEIPNDSISASSYYSSYYPWNARLNSGYFWRPSSADGSLITVIFQQLTTITGVIIEGGSSSYVQSYSVKWLNEDGSWVYVTDQYGDIEQFPGTGSSIDVESTFSQPILTTYIRLYPTKYTSTSFYLSFELLGCYDNDGLVRLADGETDNYGRLEVLHDHRWGTVCDNEWDKNDANVVCKQLGFGTAMDAKTGSFYGGSERDAVMSQVRCTGDEEQLKDCFFLCEDSQEYGCDNGHEAGVVCNNETRLVNGSKSSEGRIELYRGNKWGTICDNDWDIVDAGVLCRQMGYSSAVQAVGGAYFGEGAGTIFFDGLGCDGTEESLDECSVRDCWEDIDCDHSQDAGVTCV